MSGTTSSTNGSTKNDHQQQLSHSDVIAQFADAMRAVVPGLHQSDIVADGEIHRFTVEGDRSNSGNGWYSLHLDGHPAGIFGNWKSGDEGKWSANGKPMTMADKAAFREQMERARAKREADDQVRREKAAEIATSAWNAARHKDVQHAYLKARGIQSCGARIGNFPLIDRETGAITRTIKDALLLQVRDMDKNIHSIQAIVEQRAEDGSTRFQKLFLSSGAKRGHFHAVGQPKRNADGQYIFVVVEGFSTGASVHHATGHATVCAFDAGNLLHVAKVIRSKYPDAVILLAGDDDAFTANGNTGRKKATVAAAAVRGLVAFPVFEPDDLAIGPTDWNDAHGLYGLEFVERGINAALYPAPESENLPWDVHDQFPPEARAVPRNKPATQAEAEDQAVHEVEEQAGFRILGHQRDKVFIFVHGMKQIIERETFPLTTLMHMAPLNWWEKNFPGKGNGGSVNFNQAAEFIIRTAQRRGLYDPNCVRNGGAWTDAGRHVFHHGNCLTVDGKRMLVTAIKSMFVYEQTLPLPTPADVALTDAEGQHILDISRRFNWERSSSAALLAGWTFLAPICGALSWRPHIFLTGPAGNGKSTILRDYVHALIGKGGCVFAQGSSTEAGVRQDIGSTSLPCLIDEAERNTEREQQRIEALLALIRQSSTESDAKTLKGTVGGEGMKFNVRSMFAMAAIYTGLERKADIDRLSVLSLQPSRGDVVAAGRWEVTKEMLHILGRPESNMRGKMMRRALDNMPTVLANIKLFVKVAAEKFHSQRDGDQMGTLLSGAWSLTNSAVATPEQARAMMDGLDWTAHTEAAEGDDSQSALQELMGSFIFMRGDKHTVHNLIAFALGEEVKGRTLDGGQARAELEQHGIMLMGSKLLLSNTSSAIKRLLVGTPFATDPKAAFLRLPGAGNHGGKRETFNGLQARVTALPLETIGFGGRSVKSESDLF